MLPAHATRLTTAVAVAVSAQSLMPTSLLAQTRPPSPTQIASQKEFDRELKMQGLQGIRPGAKNGDPASPYATNYDEAKANPLPLPDPLVMADGRRTASAKQWADVRRPQIVKAMEDELYGHRPANLPPVVWTLGQERHTDDYGVPAVEKTLYGNLDNSAAPTIEVHIKVVLVTPDSAAGKPAPAVVSINWINPPPGFPKENPSADYRNLILKRGWSVVVYDPTTVQADNGAGLTQGVIGLVNRGRPRKVDDWGALSAWAWGASKVVDMLQASPAIDPSRIAIFGHSRYGKASLVAMAYDPRIKAGFISSSGAGGAAPYRRHWGEQVENVAAANEYHWMGARFLRYASGSTTAKDLTIDSNAVIALAAPRAVFIGAGRSTADGDAWVDPPGMFMAQASAGDAWALLGERPLAKTRPAPLALSDSGVLAYRQHDQGHTPGPNWPYFLDFAGKAFDRAGA